VKFWQSGDVSAVSAACAPSLLYAALMASVAVSGSRMSAMACQIVQDGQEHTRIRHH